MDGFSWLSTLFVLRRLQKAPLPVSSGSIDGDRSPGITLGELELNELGGFVCGMLEEKRGSRDGFLVRALSNDQSYPLPNHKAFMLTTLIGGRRFSVMYDIKRFLGHDRRWISGDHEVWCGNEFVKSFRSPGKIFQSSLITLAGYCRWGLGAGTPAGAVGSTGGVGDFSPVPARAAAEMVVRAAAPRSFLPVMSVDGGLEQQAVMATFFPCFPDDARQSRVAALANQNSLVLTMSTTCSGVLHAAT
nr:hypothetical protein Iba_chr13eCG10610 [Ipomoea batatas]